MAVTVTIGCHSLHKPSEGSYIAKLSGAKDTLIVYIQGLSGR